MEENEEFSQEKEQKEEKIVKFGLRLWTLPAYVWVFAFVPYFLKRKSEYVQFHAKQGVVLFIVEIILVLISPIPIIGLIVSFFGFVFCAIFSIIGMFKGLAGKKWVMPIIGKFANKMKD